MIVKSKAWGFETGWGLPASGSDLREKKNNSGSDLRNKKSDSDTPSEKKLYPNLEY